MSLIQAAEEAKKRQQELVSVPFRGYVSYSKKPMKPERRLPSFRPLSGLCLLFRDAQWNRYR